MKPAVLVKIGLFCIPVGLLVGVVVLLGLFDEPGAQDGIDSAVRRDRLLHPRRIELHGITFWWDDIPDDVRRASLETGPHSNIHPGDYVGPEACRKCHADNFRDWAVHPHRWMNARAEEANVKGDFSGEEHIEYLGGRADFSRDADGFRMRLTRGSSVFTYDVRQTIGSRFFQYYVGRLSTGPLPAEHPYFHVNHVLPFGYWLDRREWVPVVHIAEEASEALRDDPFSPSLDPRPKVDYTPYASSCNMCHTTFPLADDLVRKPFQIASGTPVQLHWHLAANLREEHPEVWGDNGEPLDVPNEMVMELSARLMDHEAEDHAVTLGISCEACHLGGREHVEDPRIRPEFHPRSPHLLIETSEAELQTGRTHRNLNWVCARCHVGERPQFAAGMSTWNSVEYSDAMVGSCYSELKCIDCHSPHQATGPEWKRTAVEDDVSCVRCHEKYESADAVAAHTHHGADSEGSRCMNCHMPRLNEGLQGVVRTHTIFSPTNEAMLEANHPNACNQCHTSEPIDWTLTYLEQWYGKKYSRERIAASYPQRSGPVAAGWMQSDREAVRLIGVDSATRSNDRSLLPEVLEALDDPYLLNRQFARIGLETMLDIRLQDYGYRFYMTKEERQEPLQRLREAFSNPPHE